MISISPPPAGIILKPSGRAYQGTAIVDTITGQWTRVDLDAISAGFTDGIENLLTNRIIPGVAGLYRIHGSVYFSTSMVADMDFYAAIDISGVYSAQVHIHSAKIGNLVIPVSLLIWLTAVNYVELYGRQDSGANLIKISPLENACFLEVQRIR